MLAHAERFEELRPELVRHAYRMLGEYGEAEDVTQDAYLRWSAAFDSSPVRDERALARTIVTRLCLDRLRSARAKREVYVGPWLPEPVISESTDDPEAAATLADDISFALMLALERLAPLERRLTDDVVFTSDGGGKVPAATVPVVGRERVTKFIFGLKEKQGWRDVIRMDLVMLNGMPGTLTFNAAGVQDATVLEIVDGRIAAMYVVRNPEKLRGMMKT
ncbi:MAG: sigma factor [Candidatus Cybelea sp.]